MNQISEFKVKPVDTNASQQDSLWQKLIWDSSNFDPDWCDYMQRVLGYCMLAPSNIEQLVFFFYGMTENGKSQITEGLPLIFESLITNFPADRVFSKAGQFKNNNSLANSYAKAEGKNLMIIEEVDDSYEWDETIIKTLTLSLIHISEPTRPY